MARGVLRGLAALLLFIAGLQGHAAMAQEASFSVGTITSAKTCTLYQQSAGEAGILATRRAVAAYASWRTWLVKDCVDNFASMRTSLEAALASAGSVAVRGSGGRFIVSGRISEVSGSGGAPYAPDGKTFAVATNYMMVNMDVTVRDRSGRILFGALLTKKMEVGSDVKVDGFQETSGESGQALYTKLQHEVALAVARQVVFHFAPLAVTSVQGREIQLNYGTPLLPMGMLIQARSPDGATVARYRVTSAGSGTALAELDGDDPRGRIGPGSQAMVIEADDPAANGRRYKKVELP